MSIFNEEQIKAMFSREYICYECGHLMEFGDGWEGTLVCPHCGRGIDLFDYGREGYGEYEGLTPPGGRCWALRMMIPRKIQTIKNIS